MCIFFCSRELCDRPYDISILGIYKQAEREESIFSGSSWASDNILKHDALCNCRLSIGVPDPYLGSEDTPAEKIVCKPSIKHPRPIRPKPILSLNTDSVADFPVSPDESFSGSFSDARDFYPVSRTSTIRTPQTYQPPVAELPATDSGVTRTTWKTSHQRTKSSLSSLRRLLPKTLPISLPLSADPQIRALSFANLHRDVEKQERASPTDSAGPESESAAGLDLQLSSSLLPSNPQPENPPDQPSNRPRSATMSSDDAPEVVPQEPPTIGKYHLIPQPTPPPIPPVPPIPIHHRPHPTPTYTPNPPRPAYHRAPNSYGFEADRLRRQASRQSMRRPNQMYNFENAQMPRHTQSTYSHARRSMSTRTRYRGRNDVEIIYPSTRRPRPRSSGWSGHGYLDSIKEVSRSSLDDESEAAGQPEPDEGCSVISESTYRGANRTSMTGF